MSNYKSVYTSQQIDNGIGRGLIAAQQVSTMPSATTGDIVQWVGATTANYTNGHWYKYNGSAWEEIVYGNPSAADGTAYHKTGTPGTNKYGIDVLYKQNGDVDGLGFGVAATSGKVGVNAILKSSFLDALGLTSKIIDSSTRPNTSGTASAGYIRFADGTQIAYGTFAAAIDINEASGALYRSSSTSVNISYAQAFINAPVVMAIALPPDDRPLLVFEIQRSASAITSMRLCRPDSVAGVTWYLGYIAIGKWK